MLTAQSELFIAKPCQHRQARFAGHSPRYDFLASAAEASADLLRMMEMSRLKRVEIVQGPEPDHGPPVRRCIERGPDRGGGGIVDSEHTCSLGEVVS